MTVGKELVRKLGIKPHSQVAALNANPYILDDIKQSLPQGVALFTELPSDEKSDVILIWLSTGDDLGKLLRKLQDSIVPDGAIWTVIPKRLRVKLRA